MPRRNLPQWLLVPLAGMLVYLNSFWGVFLFDDEPGIVHNPFLRQLWPITGQVRNAQRPVLNLSLAVNYALGGLNVWGYHLFNMAVHVLAGLTLFGVVRRTLEREPFRSTWGRSAPWPAVVLALIWVVHPLQTQSVTYLIQRSESMMGLFYLLTLYGLIHGADSAHPRRWYAASVGACVLGMGSKEVMLTAPGMVWLYDRVFLAGSFAAALRQRWGFYVGLAATCLIPLIAGGVIGALNPHPAGQTAVGFGVVGLTPWAYALTQPGVILHYLKLALWPHPLCLDYWWPIAQDLRTVVLPGIVLLVLLVGTLWAFRRRPWLGFLGAWFFMILAPTSSFIPIRDIAFEHRMYLPLAAVLMLAVVGGWSAARLAFDRLAVPGRLRQALGGGMALGVVAALGVGTVKRNETYGSRIAMWSDVIVQRPQNPRAQSDLGLALFDAGSIDEAVIRYSQALRIDPDYAKAHTNLGNALVRLGRLEEALAHHREAVRLAPDYPEVRNNLGMALAQAGRTEEAVAEFLEALRLNPDYPSARINLGNVLTRQGEVEEALGHYQEALRIEPDSPEAYVGLGNALLRLGREDEAIAHYTRAIQIAPDSVPGHVNLGLVLTRRGRTDEARVHLQEALRLAPEDPQAQSLMGNLLAAQGQLEEAIQHYTAALRSRPDYPEVHSNLGIALARQQRYAEAVVHFREAVSGTPQDAGAHYNLALALDRLGRIDEAIAEYEAVLRIYPQHAEARQRLSAAAAKRGG
ncbi:MAG: tetratricopeptide repeat protein [Planctomycetota bacterium]